MLRVMYDHISLPFHVGTATKMQGWVVELTYKPQFVLIVN